MPNTEIYGTDYSSSGEVASNGDIKIVTGLENAKQAICNQLLTRVGTYPSVDTEYGSSIFELWGEDLLKPNLEALSVHISNALYKQERVKTIKDIFPYVTIDKKLKCNMTVELVDGSDETINIEIED